LRKTGLVLQLIEEPVFRDEMRESLKRWYGFGWVPEDHENQYSSEIEMFISYLNRLEKLA